jgi:hypothetical protein
MTGLDVFALIVLLVLVVSVVGVLLALAILPGRIAQKRGHAHAEAVNVCGWCGLLTGGLLLPLAWIWAFMSPGAPELESGSAEEVTQ